MNLLKPKKLKLGDKISIIAPSGEVNKNLILNAKKDFETKGFKVKLGNNIFNSKDYLSASKEERLEDLHCAFLDDETDAIICARGGYGALKLINDIDYELIKNHPKIFCGYSDITILNAMFLKKSNLITFSGPMAQSDFANISSDFTENQFFKTLQNNTLTINNNKTAAKYNFKEVSGILFGGNLATIVSLCGIDFIPDKDFIFFAEDINEPVYKIDKYFTQLLNIDKFRQKVKAIVLGDFIGVDSAEYFQNYLTSLSKEIEVPIVSGYPISHSKTKSTIPYGAYARLSENSLTIENYLNEE